MAAPELKAGFNGADNGAAGGGHVSRRGSLSCQDTELLAKLDDAQGQLEAKDEEIAALKAIIAKKKTMSTRGSVTGALGPAKATRF